jgi:protein-disulfide isomerase
MKTMVRFGSVALALLSVLVVARDARPFVSPSVPALVIRPRFPGDLFVLSTDPVLGDDTARVTIVEFSDLQCPYCRNGAVTLTELRAKYGSELRIVWKDMPLTFHAMARPAAKAGRVAFLVGGSPAFWKLEELIFSQQYALSTKLSTWADSVGADASATTRYGTIADALIDDSIKLARELGVNGTPAFFIDGVSVTGAQPVDAFSKIIDEHLSEAKLLLASGVPARGLYSAMLARHPPTVTKEKD